jgi:DNA polymerase II large subunit
MDGEITTSVAVSKNMQKYFDTLQNQIDECYKIAGQARKKGFDPNFNVEIPQAFDLAERVEELVGPKDIAPKIRKITKKLGNREIVSLEIARYIANEKSYNFTSTEKALDQAIRTGLAILTEGVLVAPLEGIAEVKLGSNNDGSKYVDLFFSGPIRSAGGTGQAMSVLIADVVRRELGIDSYKPTEKEIERYKEEIPLYKRVQHLQYTPTVDEIHQIVSNCPICINGEGTEEEEVTGNRDLPRVESNRLRGGACLVIAEGLCLKAPKIIKHVKKLKLKGWNFLEIFVNKNNSKNNEETSNEKEIPEIIQSKKYIEEVIAGRPVFSHPSRKGGFRLRYGRARTAGLASTAIHPSAMYITDEFIAVGTQMKTERPGKATIGTPCSEIDGPIILMNNGDLIEYIENKPIKQTKIKKIIDLGEILIPYGEFLENNANLPNAPYSYEWWIQDLQKSLDILPNKNTKKEINKADETTQEKINEKFKQKINIKKPTYKQAIELSKSYSIPLHPYYNLFWHDIEISDVIDLSSFIKTYGKLNEENLFQIPNNENIKNILIKLGALHTQEEGIITFNRYNEVLLNCLGLSIENNKIIESSNIKHLDNTKENDSVTSLVSKLLGTKIQPKAPYRIGTRMGRPEKAAMRKMRPPPHVLFPIGNFGTNQRLLNKAAEHGEIEVEAGKRKCIKCEKTTYKLVCRCGNHTEPIENRIEIHTININKSLEEAKKNLRLRTIPDAIKGVQGTISKHKTPEPLEKGILRSKHEVTVFKDGTIRFDMTDAPVTHFKPTEAHITIQRLHELGYNTDYLGNILENDNQICELKVQDVIISKSCAEYFIKVAAFIDDLLVRFYKQDRFYNIKKLEDLIGHLVIGLAPHTSGGSLARVIGFTSSQVCFSHPYYHAAKRRNCISQNTNITTVSSNLIKIQRIKDFYDNIKNDEEIIDDYDTLKKSVTNVEALSFSKKEGKLVPCKINHVIKTKSPNHQIVIKLNSGREFTVSPYHRCLIYNNGKNFIKKAIELNENDEFLTSKKVSIDDLDVSEFDLLYEYSKIKGSNDYVAIRGISDLIRKLVQKLGGLKSTSEIIGINKKTFSNYIYRDSIPLNILIELLKHSNMNLLDIPKDCLIGLKRKKIFIPRIIKIDPWFMRLIGYYLSEGYTHSKIKSCYQICICCSEKELRNDVKRCISKVFKVNYFKNQDSIIMCNRLIYVFFTKILCLGNGASEKRIPSILASLSKPLVKELLGAYFSGDGSVEKNRLHVSCSSISKNLLEDIGFQLSRFGIYYRLKYEQKKAGGAVKKYYEKIGKKPPFFHLYYISIRSTYAKEFYEKIGFTLNRKQKLLESSIHKERKPRIQTTGDFVIDPIKKLSVIKSQSDYVYDLSVENLHNFSINNLTITNNCDGDEDGLMLLMDALLNFSHEYIPDKRGGKMDLPLIITTRLDPSEVDKEAHNLDLLARYPLEFYEATIKHTHPKDLENIMDVVGNRLGTPLQYEQFGFTHDTNSISDGPTVSRYKTLTTMMDKMNAQLDLAAKIRAVDEADVAYKVIERHFLPDILGNLRAFCKQSVRCPKCNITYRRVPLSGKCRECNGKLILTVHEKSVKKYLDISKDVAKRYHISPYAIQRINLVEKNIDSLFMSDKIKKTKLTDFL